MRELIRNLKPLRRAYYRMQVLQAKGQSDEADIIGGLCGNAPKTFVEFGFHPIQFNCAALARNPAWRGLLIDGSYMQVSDARALMPNRIDVVQRFLTFDDLEFIKHHFQQIGVLSIDVDGNDYWFLRGLIETRPNVVCVEYNSSFGIEPITVPYEAEFDRHQKHPTGWYHGASLTALAKLCATSGYGLAAVSEGGANAFFTPTGRLDPVRAWKPNVLREKYSGRTHADQWLAIKELPFISV